MLKVAVVTDYCPVSSHPWAGHSAYQTLRFLAGMCDLRVFYPQAVYPAFLRPASDKVASIDRTWSPPDVRICYIPFPVLPVVTRQLNGFTSAARLLPRVSAFAPDIILNYAVYPHGLAAVRIARALRVPSVLTAIGSDLNRPADAVCAWLTRQTLRRADFVVTVSQDLCNTALRLGAPQGSTCAVQNGCDTSIFHPRDRAEARRQLSLDPEAEIVVYVGRLDLRKGLLELIESAASLRATHPRLRTYILGDGPDRPALVEAIARHNVADTVTLVPSCLSPQVAVWMAASNLVTLPSYAEGSPNVVIEALSAGRPVVASKVGGIPELMDSSSGRLVPSRDVPALTRALDEVLSSAWNADAISSRRSRGWAAVADDMLQILKTVAAR